MWNTRRRKEKGTKEIFEKNKWVRIFQNFLTDNRAQIQELRSSENMTQDKSKISTLRHITNRRKSKTKEKSSKRPEVGVGEKKPDL